MINIQFQNSHTAIYSATIFLEKWFCKLRFFFLVNHFSRTRKKIRLWRTTFLQPEKGGFIVQTHLFFWSTTFLEPEKKSEFAEPLFSNLKKMWIYSINPPFFLVNHFSRTRKKIQVWRTIFHQPDFSNQISRTRFLEPLFYTFLEKWLQIKWSFGYWW